MATKSHVWEGKIPSESHSTLATNLSHALAKARTPVPRSPFCLLCLGMTALDKEPHPAARAGYRSIGAHWSSNSSMRNSTLSSPISNRFQRQRTCTTYLQALKYVTGGQKAQSPSSPSCQRGDRHLQRTIQNTKAQLYLLKPPWSHQPSWTDTCPQGLADHTTNCATCSALQRDDLLTWESKKNLTETRVCSQDTLPCPSVVVSYSSGDWGRERETRESERRETGSLMSYRSIQPHPMAVFNHLQFHKWGPGPGDGFSLQYCSPSCTLVTDVVASYHLGPFTPRIKLLACPPAGVFTSKSCYCGYQSLWKWPHCKKVTIIKWGLSKKGKKNKSTGFINTSVQPLSKPFMLSSLWQRKS